MASQLRLGLRPPVAQLRSLCQPEVWEEEQVAEEEEVWEEEQVAEED